MRSLLIAIAACALAACGSSTEPGGAGDPSIMVTNDLTASWTYVAWKDGQGILGRDSVAPRSAKCLRFLAQPDSAYWEISVSENQVASTQSYGWFDPAARPAWTVLVSHNGLSSPSILTTETDAPC